jgi:hypothetical protein
VTLKYEEYQTNSLDRRNNFERKNEKSLEKKEVIKKITNDTSKVDKIRQSLPR